MTVLKEIMDKDIGFGSEHQSYYDALNLVNIQVTNTTSGDLDFPFTYNVTGLRNSVGYPNGVTTEYEYYPTGAVYTIGVSNSSGALEALTYTYDTSGNRKSMARAGIEAGFPSAFTNAPIYDAANRLTSFNSATVLYDDNGNMTDWGSTTYTWDARNRLIAINGTSLDASFTYDAMGRRIAKTINGTTTKYLYDGLDIIMEMDGSGVPTAFYVRTLSIDEPLARIDLSSGEIRYYHADALGSVIALTDENSTVVTQYNYSPFGKTVVTGSDSTGLSQPFRYTGREWDGDTGLYYYRARYYSPEMSRFISEDPIGLLGGINMYAYVGNTPLNFTDPFGLREWTITRGGASIGAAIVGLRGEIIIFTSNCEDNIKITKTYFVIGVGLSVGLRLTISGGMEGHLGGEKFPNEDPSPTSGLSVSGLSGGFIKGSTFGSATFALDDEGRLTFGEGSAVSTGSIYGASIFSFMGEYYIPLDIVIEECGCKQP